MQTIEKVLSARTVAQRSSPKVNLTEACTEVVKNKGAGGIDRMSVGQLKAYLDLNREELCETIREGCKVGDCKLTTYQTVTNLNRATTVGITTISPIIIHCCGYAPFIFGHQYL